MSEQRLPLAHLRAAFAQRLAGTGWRTRFAPAPTGYLHLGHLVNAIFVWGLARAYGGRVVLRIEDHDRQRSRPEFERALLDDLEWLGLVPDEAALPGSLAKAEPFRQSDHGAAYENALKQLRDAGRVYVCRCTRRVIAALAPHRVGEESPYPGTCRLAALADDASLARRVRLDDTIETFDDLRLGVQQQRPMAQCGDLLVRDRLGQWTYQFAVTVDDVNQGIDVVIRGEDLLESTGRQVQLARLLGRGTPPHFLHHPLLRHEGGLKLSKSHGDTGIGELRAQGHSAASLLGLAAERAGLTGDARSIRVDDLPSLFV